jgi:hypothetical protein
VSSSKTQFVTPILEISCPDLLGPMEGVFLAWKTMSGLVVECEQRKRVG